MQVRVPLCRLACRWNQVDFKGLLHVRQKKNGIGSTHPFWGLEIRALRRIEREHPETQFIFVSERKGPMTTSTFRKLIDRAARLANLGFPTRPHMLRHATGFKLANDCKDTRAIQYYLGHKNIQHTVTYIELAPHRSNGFFDD